MVALTSSRYYDDKFLGLADMFGVGLTLVRLDDASLEITFDGLRVRVIGKDDLIAMKREAGRPQDLEDIAALTEAERRRGELGG